MKNWPLGGRVGILGGGQLARMLAHSAQRMGLEVHVLSSDAHDPAAQVTAHHRKGSPHRAADLSRFLKDLDFLTFESEFFDMDVLESVLPKGLQVFPRTDLMRALQDRRPQKELLVTQKIPTAPFVAVDEPSGLARAWEKFPKGFVLKKARGGYDGYGTFYARQVADLDRLAKGFPGPSIAESFIPFKRELAVTAVCGPQDFAFLPLVESKQTQSRCDWVKGPVRHPAWPALSQKLRRMLKRIGYRGVIAFELFDTGRDLLVNEIAPRVHNSAHYSMDALAQSQFDLHWIAGMGFAFKAPRLLHPAFVMTNLLGESSDPFRIPPGLEGRLHWYGKNDNRPGRKMGHVNHLGARPDPLLKKALLERKRIRK